MSPNPTDFFLICKRWNTNYLSDQNFSRYIRLTKAKFRRKAQYDWNSLLIDFLQKSNIHIYIFVLYLIYLIYCNFETWMYHFLQNPILRLSLRQSKTRVHEKYIQIFHRKYIRIFHQKYIRIFHEKYIRFNFLLLSLSF